jgi:hypothetical protein
MKKLLFFAFCIFSSVFILHSTPGISQMLDKLKQEVAEGCGKCFEVTFFYVADGGLSLETAKREFLEVHQRVGVIKDKFKEHGNGEGLGIIFSQPSISLKPTSLLEQKAREQEVAEIYTECFKKVLDYIVDKDTSLEEVASKLSSGNQRVRAIGEEFRSFGKTLSIVCGPARS